MKSCNTCRFKSVSLTGNKTWKCKQFGNVKRFNYACLHGWFCKYFMNDSASIKYFKTEGNKKYENYIYYM